MMRITNGMTLRHYHRSLNKIANLKSNSMLKIESGREYFRASESPVKAAKALTIRKQIYDTEQFKENLKVADKFYTEAETSLLKVSDTLAGIRELVISGVSTAKDEQVDLQIIAQQIETKAQEICSVFNTDTAERVIFGGESNNPEPFTIRNGEALYHGVPFNAYSDYRSFPYSNDVYIDIGVGIQVDQETQAVDPQTALKISFNGADITGCGSDGGGVADIDLSSIKDGKRYSIDVMVGNISKKVVFAGKKDPADTVAEIKASMDEAFNGAAVVPEIDESGVISAKGNSVNIINSMGTAYREELSYVNQNGYSGRYGVNLDELVSNQEYKMNVKIGDENHIIKFTAGADAEESVKNIQNAMDNEFVNTKLSNDYTVKPYKQAPLDSDKKVDFSKLEKDQEYSIVVANGGANKVVTFKAGATAADSETNYRTALNTAGITLAAGDPLPEAAAELVPLNDDGTIAVGSLEDGKNYYMELKDKDGNDVTPAITFTGTDNADDNIDTINTEITNAGITDTEISSEGFVPKVSKEGYITMEGQTVTLGGVFEEEDVKLAPTRNLQTYSDNYIQLTLDAAKAFRDGNLEYANGCIDRIVEATENLLVQVTDLGNSEDYIEFMQDRYDTRLLNLDERQKDVEACDEKMEITLMKQYEALYNACLQMSSQVIPNSIFNYIS